MDGLVGKEVAPTHFWWDVALAHIGALCRRQPLGETARWLDPIEVHVGARADQIAETVVIDPQPVDLVEAADPSGRKGCLALASGANGCAHSSSQADPWACTAM